MLPEHWLEEHLPLKALEQGPQEQLREQVQQQDRQAQPLAQLELLLLGYKVSQEPFQPVPESVQPRQALQPPHPASAVEQE